MKEQKNLKSVIIVAIDDILTVQWGKIAHNGNNTKRIREMNQWKRDVEAWNLKSNKIRMKKWTKKEKNYCQI